MQEHPAVLPVLPHLTDWQILAFFAEKPRTGQIVPYDDLFYWAWSQRGYSDTEIDRIRQWHKELQGDDDKVWQRMIESGMARE